MGFVEIIQAIKTRHVSLLKISMLVQNIGEILPQLCCNDSIQILLKIAWLLALGFVWVIRAYPWQDVITDWWQMLIFGMEAFFIMYFLNSTTKLAISQIKFL